MSNTAGKAAARVIWFWAMASAVAVAAPPGLRIERDSRRAQPALSQAAATNQVVRLDASTDLAQWTEVARLHGPFEAFPAPVSSAAPYRFYRTAAWPKTASDDWKNHATYPLDPLLSADPGWGQFEPRWLKFVIVLDEPHRIYFQDSAKYVFHYDFAVQRLPQFKNLTRAQFDAISLRRANQQVILGSVLFAPGENLTEIAIQFVGLDPYPVEDVADWFDRVRAVVEAPPNANVFYFPTYEQQAMTAANREFFQQRGIEVSSAARWTTADECYAQGWALGRLVFVPVASLSEYFSDGRLRATDLLLIDAVPAEIPPLGGRNFAFASDAQFARGDPGPVVRNTLCLFRERDDAQPTPRLERAGSGLASRNRMGGDAGLGGEC